MSTWLDHPLHCPCTECAARDYRYAGRRGTARALIQNLSRRGVSFRLVDEKIRFRPTSKVTDEERSEIRRVRDELHRLLAEDEARRLSDDGYVRDVGEAFELMGFRAGVGPG